MDQSFLVPPAVETDKMLETDLWVMSTMNSSMNDASPRQNSINKKERLPVQKDQPYQYPSSQPLIARNNALSTSQQQKSQQKRRRSSLTPSDMRHSLLPPLPSALPALPSSPPITAPEASEFLKLPAINCEPTRLPLNATPNQDLSAPCDRENSGSSIASTTKHQGPTDNVPRRRKSIDMHEIHYPTFNPEDFFPPDDPVPSIVRRNPNAIPTNRNARRQSIQSIQSVNLKGRNTSSAKRRGSKKGGANAVNKGDKSEAITNTKSQKRKKKKSKTSVVNKTNKSNSSVDSAGTRRTSLESVANQEKNLITQPLVQPNARVDASAEVSNNETTPQDQEIANDPIKLAKIEEHGNSCALKIPEIRTTSEAFDGSGLRREGERNDTKGIVSKPGGEAERRDNLRVENGGQETDGVQSGGTTDNSDDEKAKEKRKRLSREDAKYIDDAAVIQIKHSSTRDEEALRMPCRKMWGSNSFKGSISINMLHPTVRFYHQICSKLGILPLRKVLAQFGRSHLSFRDLSFTTKDMKAVCLALQKEENASSLDFTGNRIGQKGVDYLMSVLNQLRTVYQVSLCNNWLSGSPVQTISGFLLMNDFIARLDLSGNKLTDNDAAAITEILKKNTTIKTLVLNHNEFREEGGVLLGRAIAKNTTLEDIDLSWNHLRQSGAVGIAKGLQSNGALRTVNLAWNGFGFEGCLAIGDMLVTNHTITELDLAYNRINPPALLELLRGLSSNRTLRILRIGFNPITAAFSSLILAVIQRHRETGLENIDMAGVVVDKEFVALLEEIQKDRFFIVNYEVSLPVKKMSREEMREKIGLPSAYNVDPLRMLYLLKEKMRASDFFYKINKDHDDGLQRDELYSLFDEAGIPVTGSVVDKIMEFMDTNGDGTIDLGEFLQGDKTHEKHCKEGRNKTVVLKMKATRNTREPSRKLTLTQSPTPSRLTQQLPQCVSPADPLWCQGSPQLQT